MGEPIPKSRAEQLSRDQWLASALEVLRQEGVAGVRIVPIARMLGVTTGSFYWHFKDRHELLQSMLEYWVKTITESVIDEINAVEGSAEQRLLALVDLLTQRELTRYELAIRAWAAFDETAAEVVKKVDTERIAYVRRLFGELGFRGDEAETRARMLVYYQVAEPSIMSRESTGRRQKLMRLRHELLTHR